MLVLIVGYLISFSLLKDERGVVPNDKGLSGGWEPFSLNRFFSAIDNNETVVLDFTADWCANCKVLERMVLFSKEIKNRFKQDQVRTMVVDMTMEDMLKKQFLTALGSRTIPYLAVFPGNAMEKNKPLFVRDMYTRRTVVKLLDRARDINNE